MKAKNEFKSEMAYREYLTLYFANSAMRGLLSLPHTDSDEEFTPEHIAAVSLTMAQALVGETRSYWQN